MGRLLSLEAVGGEVLRHRERGRKVALANGVFDLLHVGHLRYLEGAKALGDVLVVALNSDVSARALKGPGRPVVPQHERAELLCALGCVDYVVLFDGPDVRPIIRALKPDVHVKGTDYTPESIPERDEVQAYGGRVAVAGDPKDHSTTEQLTKVKGRLRTLADHLSAENRHDLEAIMATYAANPVVTINGRAMEGVEQVRAFHLRFGFSNAGSFSDVRVDERARHETAAAIILEQTLSGRHTGEWEGLAPTGNTFSVSLCTVYRFAADGLLQSEDVYFDRARLRKQLASS